MYCTFYLSYESTVRGVGTDTLVDYVNNTHGLWFVDLYGNPIIENISLTQLQYCVGVHVATEELATLFKLMFLEYINGQQSDAFPN